MSPAGTCRMITDIQKYKNDNLFSDQVLVLLMFSNGRKCELVMKLAKDGHSYLLYNRGYGCTSGTWRIWMYVNPYPLKTKILAKFWTLCS